MQISLLLIDQLSIHSSVSIHLGWTHVMSPKRSVHSFKMKDFISEWATNRGTSLRPFCWVWELLFTWLTIFQVKPEHPLTMQLQQEFKLNRHGMDCVFRLYVIVVVVSQRMESLGVITKGPEPIKMHIGTMFQRQARHHQAGAGTCCF